jgi:hypothetical protein
VTAPGWYPSPPEFSTTPGEPSGLFRWHDGYSWTAHVGPSATARPPAWDRPHAAVAVPDPVTAPLDLPETSALQLVQDVPLCGLVYVTDHDWHPDVARARADEAARGGTCAPVRLMRHDGRLHVVDGRHRVVGWLLAGRATIPALVLDGCAAECPCTRLAS